MVNLLVMGDSREGMAKVWQSYWAKETAESVWPSCWARETAGIVWHCKAWETARIVWQSMAQLLGMGESQDSMVELLGTGDSRESMAELLGMGESRESMAELLGMGDSLTARVWEICGHGRQLRWVWQSCWAWETFAMGMAELLGIGDNRKDMAELLGTQSLINNDNVNSRLTGAH